MAISDQDRRILLDMKQSNLMEKLGKNTFDIYEFQKLVSDGDVSDDIGTARLIIDGEIKNDYLIFIDRQCILKSGSIISFWGLLKQYGKENIKIHFELK